MFLLQLFHYMHAPQYVKFDIYPFSNALKYHSLFQELIAEIGMLEKQRDDLEAELRKVLP